MSDKTSLSQAIMQVITLLDRIHDDWVECDQNNPKFFERHKLCWDRMVELEKVYRELMEARGSTK